MNVVGTAIVVIKKETTKICVEKATFCIVGNAKKKMCVQNRPMMARVLDSIGLLTRTGLGTRSKISTCHFAKLFIVEKHYNFMQIENDHVIRRTCH